MPELSTLEINGVPYDLRDPTKAPAGYGLGGDANHGMPPITDANTATRNGWYHINTATANTPGVNGVMRADSYIEGSVMQTIFCTSWSASYHAMFQRVRLNGTWQEWDWVDPPMVLGVEYRTTERHNGKAVYTKLVDCVAIVNGTKQIPHGASATQMIRCNATLSSGNWRTTIPYNDGTQTINAHADVNNILLVANFVGFNACAQIWYTKD